MDSSRISAASRATLAASLAAVLAGGALAAPQSAPYGSWASPVPAADLAKAAVSISDVRVFDGTVYWRESRPSEQGRQVLRRLGEDGPESLTPEGYSVRTRVHEYGGSSYWVFGERIVFANFADQRLYLQSLATPEAAPRPITPPDYQYADCVHSADGSNLICVREDHTEATKKVNGEERNEIVRLPLPTSADDPVDAGTVLVSGSDFVAYPRLSPDGRQLAWIEWNHPAMPWDRTTLKLAPVLEDGSLGEAQTVAGGDRAVLEPQWAADGTLYYIDELSGWWNLYAWKNGRGAPVAPMARELAGPLWQLGMQSYLLAGPEQAIVRSSLEAVDELGLIDLSSGSYRKLALPIVAVGDIQLDASGRIISTVASVDDVPALVAIDPASGKMEVLHRTGTRTIGADFVSVGEPIRFPTTAGPEGEAREAHATWYPPRNPAFTGPEGSKPPLIVLIHGGPTGVSEPVYSLSRQYWTSRGFGLVDVNYGGSTSYGRAYRKRLEGQWGVVDVQDAVAAVDHLVAAGKVDPEQVAIRGGSAGGFTTLAALAFTDRFKAGANYFGVSDIAGLAATSHKFESRYDVSLIGEPDPALYRERSPIFHLDGFREPLITFQGADDRIVTPDQSRRIVAALAEKGVMHAYLEFEGEQHGFRKAENIIRAQEAELYFYAQVFGFEPADEIEPVEIVR
jgi:dipeptidyl aminopeptidase/acylaminoacyl peptidase